MSDYRVGNIYYGPHQYPVFSAKDIEAEITLREALKGAKKIQERAKAAQKIKESLSDVAKNEGGGGGGASSSQRYEDDEGTWGNVIMNLISPERRRAVQLRKDKQDFEDRGYPTDRKEWEDFSKYRAMKRKEGKKLERDINTRRTFGRQSGLNAAESAGNRLYEPFGLNRKLAEEDRGMQNAMSSGFSPLSKYAPEYDAVSRIRQQMGYNGGFRGSVRSDKYEAMARAARNMFQEPETYYNQPYNDYSKSKNKTLREKRAEQEAVEANDRWAEEMLY